MSFGRCKESTERGYGRLIFKIKLLGPIGFFSIMDPMRKEERSESPS
jgi:hypothetical protein